MKPVTEKGMKKRRVLINGVVHMVPEGDAPMEDEETQLAEFTKQVEGHAGPTARCETLALCRYILQLLGDYIRIVISPASGMNA